MTLLPACDYPWAEPPRSGLLTRTGLLAGAPPPDLDDRTPVAAVGSNASPTILRTKLGPLLATGLPVTQAVVERLAVGHSAHVSARGYIAAAPFFAVGSRRGNASRPVMLGWFDRAQLAAMDATEPNYQRIPLPSRMPCHLDGVPLTGVEIYASVHGVLGEAGAPLQFLSQADVLTWLVHRLPPAVADALDHATLVDADRREQVRAALLAADLVVPSGL